MHTPDNPDCASYSVGANLALHRSIGDQSVQLNFNITMLDLPCNYAAVDVFSTTGHQKDIVKNIKKFPIDINGVLLNDEEQTWHQNDVELWDPAVWETIENLHEDGEDAIRLNNESFPFGKHVLFKILVRSILSFVSSLTCLKQPCPIFLW